MIDLGKLTVNVVQKVTAATGTSAAIGGGKGLLGGLIPSAGLKPSTYQYRATQAMMGARGSLGGMAQKEEAFGDLSNFLRRPSARGAQDLLSHDGAFGAMLRSGGTMSRLAPVITTSISAIGKLAGAAGLAGLAIGAYVAGVKKAMDAIQSFVDSVVEYSGRLSAARGRADVDREMAKMKAGGGLGATAGSVFERAMGKMDASFTRFMAAVTPVLTTFAVPAIELLTLVVDTLSEIFEWLNKSFGILMTTLGAVIAAIGLALIATLNPVGVAVGVGLTAIGAGVIYMGQKLDRIDKNTRPEDDFLDANAPFIQDLALMGVTDWAGARLK